MTSPMSSDEPVTPDQLRRVDFTISKRGYEPEEVDALLDRVSATLAAHVKAVEEAERRAQGAEQPTVLHDPEGAAQRLLAAAQKTADSMTAEAEAYADQTRGAADEYATGERKAADDYASKVRGEADDYASTVRAEADEHAATVTSSAERKAEAVLGAATEEARRAAEEARSALVDEMAALRTDRDALRGDVGRLRDHIEQQREELLATIDRMRAAIAEGEALSTPPVLSTVDEVDLAVPDQQGAAATPDEAVSEDLAGSVVPPADEAPTSATDEAEPVETALGVQSGAVREPDLPEEPRSVVDLFATDDAAAVDDDSTERDESGLFAPETSDRFVEPEADIDSAAASIFDVAPDTDAGPPTEAVPFVESEESGLGDRFFDELRRADSDSGSLGPLDDDTDAALSAFFEPDEDELDARWSDRFGSGD